MTVKYGKYLPCWANNKSFQKLYSICWIMRDSLPAVNLSAGESYASLLPIRFYNDGNFRSDYGFSSVGRYLDGFELCRTSNIRSSKSEFALQLWKASAEILFQKCPNIMNLKFGEQDEEGIYDITFQYSYSYILNLQKSIMSQMISDGFSVDEYMNINYSVKNKRKTWHYDGVVGLSVSEMRDVFYNTPYGDNYPIKLRSGVQYSFEDCEEFYKIFDEDELLFGNQMRAYKYYAYKKRPLFDAVKQKDLTEIQKLLNHGFSLNEIDEEGETAFAILIRNLIGEDSDITEKEKQILDKYMASGANPALFGVNATINWPILDAAVNVQPNLFKWLIDIGVNPYLPLWFDENCYSDSYYATVIDFIEDYFNEDYDERENDERFLKMKNILNTLKIKRKSRG